jgi:hypothetical protein
MAKVIDWNGPDWDAWFDGRAWELTRGEDFDKNVESFRGSVLYEAKKREIKVKVAVVSPNVVRLKKVLPNPQLDG